MMYSQQESPMGPTCHTDNSVIYSSKSSYHGTAPLVRKYVLNYPFDSSPSEMHFGGDYSAVQSGSVHTRGRQLWITC